jgi:hypothetical protein
VNKAWATAWEQIEELATRIASPNADQHVHIAREGHRFQYKVIVDGCWIELWAVEDSPNYCASVRLPDGLVWGNAISFRCWNPIALEKVIDGLIDSA